MVHPNASLACDPDDRKRKAPQPVAIEIELLLALVTDWLAQLLVKRKVTRDHSLYLLVEVSACLTLIIEH